MLIEYRVEIIEYRVGISFGDDRIKRVEIREQRV